MCSMAMSSDQWPVTTGHCPAPSAREYLKLAAYQAHSERSVNCWPIIEKVPPLPLHLGQVAIVVLLSIELARQG